MTKVRIKAGADAMQEADKDGGEFVLPPKGYYVLTLKECNPELAKDNEGNPDESRPYLNVIWEITGVGVDEKPVEENYGNVWDVVSFSDSSEWKRAEFLWALALVETKGDAEWEGDTEELVGSKALARIKHEKGREKDSPTRAKIAKLLRYQDGAMAGDPFGGAAGATEFGGDEAEAPAEDEAQPYTEEELAELDPKALGNVAKEEFELDPNALLVKVKGKVDLAKSKAAIISAILEAQEAGATEDADEESPF